MSDIFISYKREDRPRAREIANKFKEHGFSVWWDRKIPPGKTFDQVIQEALDWDSGAFRPPTSSAGRATSRIPPSSS